MASKPHNPGQLGLFRPESSWKPPTELPDLRGRPIVAIDTETHDLGIANNKGPGWPFGREMCRLYGVSWAAEGSAGYAPIHHPDTANFELEPVLEWLEALFRSGTRIVMHNSGYDCGVLGTYGVSTPVNLEDTLAAEVMLNENAYGYSLDACCARAGIPGKDIELMRDAVRAYGGNPAKPAGELHRLPAQYVGPYATQDGVATLDLWRSQEPKLKAQEVWEAYRTEVELIPMTVAMRRRGVRIDVDKAKRTGQSFRDRSRAFLNEISDKVAVGRRLNIEDIRSPQFLERLFTAENIPFPRTPKTKQGSFSADWMEKYDHWLPKLVVQATRYEDAANKFIDNYLLGFVHRGRVHAEVHQFRSDEGGTKSHRFSYSEPPLQQMPSPDKGDKADIGKAIRGCFMPERGDAWCSNDFSSQEPRITVHFASLCKCSGADAVVDEYNGNPRTDYHQVVADMVNLPRSKAKILNLAMTYGKGKKATAEELGLSLSEAEDVLRQYHSRLPYIKALDETCKNRASTRGYIRLIDGARIRYEEWEGSYLTDQQRREALEAGHRLTPCSLEEALERQAIPGHPWGLGRLRRADTRKGLNNLVQGSAARQTKIAMRNMFREGIVPLISVHDEVAASVATEAQAMRIEQLMREAVPLRVPVVVDTEFGPNWGEAKMTWEQYRAAIGQVG